MNVKIAIVNSSSFGKYFPEHIERLKALGDVDRFEFPQDMRGKELAEKLMGYSIIIASVKPYYDKEFFEYKDKTLLITRHGIGYDNIDVKSANEKETIVTKVQGIVEREAVAESAVALLLDVIRKVKSASIKVKEGKWNERANFLGCEIKGKNVGIIGLGNIGSRVCKILKNGFNARVIAYDPNITDEEIRRRGAIPVSLEELLKISDIISLNASLNSGNYHLLKDKEFNTMKKGVYIVDTARGELIDQKALVKALKDGIVGGIGMDVVENEPIDEENELLSFDNVTITPHISAYTYECLKGMGDKVVEDIERVLKGELPDGVIK
ncbi:D-isomer specific 2-hydroxyacid dehydrogenase NAD-binding [Thermoanaerobacterium thermosaccharolyticum DSM 571]|uniref:D-isomer specific 2-hydroxyacid dehydrogenase NAD-binding n=1 Tax=Thermoanaerobacterium thermosaccharolyticum (strain ATCC 7956 / DSM 571 / NCIMB 9385 / NCA 3814 / NCTC 13789 / WDCM 00135 / 2032) TaxID=580327 RepID=D9TTE4_THETC|nr:D-isomer specific 2-hydroxyacid dehydrogenase family protein [Thermoanaerobacterium thermosaccharolyticum]ADL69920.1 D-isomer specific 2-hydroxyacid dehydrogenase NAD-binding [Thermoanaerobacterium thermosaccharolyticum DSM 571]